MSGNIYRLKVDLKQKHTQITPTFVQYDDARIDFQLFDNGKAFNLTGFTIVEVAHKLVDGTVIVGAGEITVNEKDQPIVRYDYLGSEMTKGGFIDTSFSIFDAEDNKVSIQPFKVHIIKDNRDDIVDIANPEFGLLQTYQAQLVDLKADMNAKIVEADVAITNANDKAIFATEQGDYATTKGNEALAYATTETDAIVEYTREIADANINIPLNPVANFAALATTYPTPVFGSKAQTTDDGQIYRWNGTIWKYVEVMNSNMLTDIQNKLAIGLVEINATAPTTTATFWLDTSFE